MTVATQNKYVERTTYRVVYRYSSCRVLASGFEEAVRLASDEIDIPWNAYGPDLHVTEDYPVEAASRIYLDAMLLIMKYRP